MLAFYCVRFLLFYLNRVHSAYPAEFSKCSVAWCSNDCCRKHICEQLNDIRTLTIDRSSDLTMELKNDLFFIRLCQEHTWRRWELSVSWAMHTCIIVHQSIIAVSWSKQLNNFRFVPSFDWWFFLTQMTEQTNAWMWLKLKAVFFRFQHRIPMHISTKNDVCVKMQPMPFIYSVSLSFDTKLEFYVSENSERVNTQRIGMRCNEITPLEIGSVDSTSPTATNGTC